MNWNSSRAEADGGTRAHENQQVHILRNSLWLRLSASGRLWYDETSHGMFYLMKSFVGKVVFLLKNLIICMTAVSVTSGVILGRLFRLLERWRSWQQELITGVDSPAERFNETAASVASVTEGHSPLIFPPVQRQVSLSRTVGKGFNNLGTKSDWPKQIIWIT